MKKLLIACAVLTCALAPVAFAEPTPPPATPAADANANVAAPGVTFNAHSTRTAPPAAVQNNNIMAEVQQLLAADWRPVVNTPGGDVRAAFQAACTGTDEELTALHSHLTPGMTVAQFRQIRNPHGLIIIPGRTTSSVVFFPNAQLSWVGGGMGTLIIQDIDHARIDLRDSQGAILQVQLAQVAGQAVIQVLHDNQPVAVYVACASTAVQPHAAPTQPAQPTRLPH